MYSKVMWLKSAANTLGIKFVFSRSVVDESRKKSVNTRNNARQLKKMQLREQQLLT